MAGNLNSGRKSKSDEIELIERLGVLDDEAFEQLRKGIERGEFAYIKIFLAYRYGRPKQQQDINLINAEQPLFNLN
jgi:hypothetical protein